MSAWALLAAPAPARGQAYGSSETPSFPVRSTTRLVSETCTRDRDAEHLARVCDQEVPRPLRERGPARGDGMLGFERAKQGAVFSLRKPDEEALSTRMRHWGTAGTSHDLLISESRDARSTHTPTESGGRGPCHILPTGLTSLPPSYQSPPEPPSEDPETTTTTCLRDRIRTSLMKGPEKGPGGFSLSARDS
jgi:hypothetical protein